MTTLYCFFMPNCRHSTEFMSIWNQLKTEYANIKFKNIDYSKDPDTLQLMHSYSIYKLPSMVLVTSTNRINYEGEHNLENIRGFLNRHCSNHHIESHVPSYWSILGTMLNSISESITKLFTW